MKKARTSVQALNLNMAVRGGVEPPLPLSLFNNLRRPRKKKGRSFGGAVPYKKKKRSQRNKKDNRTSVRM
ncbi:hypothetical protein, partial [Salmonella enterica]|uniref:hypothetical protein n=1 Tax=Salmonella enterica TaxID=28901 RepID=UPI0038B8BF26